MCTPQDDRICNNDRLIIISVVKLFSALLCVTDKVMLKEDETHGSDSSTKY